MLFPLHIKSSIRVILFSCACVLHSYSSAQVPLEVDLVSAFETSDKLLIDWKLESADQALGAGLAGLALGLYNDLLGVEELTFDQRVTIRIHSAVAKIVLGDFKGATASLDLIPEEARDSQYYLYQSLAKYARGSLVEPNEIEALLENVSIDSLSSADVPWFFFAEGLLADLKGLADDSVAFYRQSVDAAQTEAQRSFFKAMVWRQSILDTRTDSSLVEKLSAQFRQIKGRSARYLYVKEYSIVLYNLDRSSEAVDVINEELSRANGLTSAQRDQLILLRGLMLGVDREGADVLRELIRSGQHRDSMRIALQLLAVESNGVFVDFLNRMIERSPAHRLLGEMYYLRSQLALSGDTPDLLQAEADARLLLEQFPGLNKITNTYRVLAYVSLQRKPPQYRVAADFLIQLRDQSQDIASLRSLNRMIGDCYFLNEDYANAVDFYQTALQAETLSLGTDGDLLLRLITAQVKSGDVSLAIKEIDQADFSGSINKIDRWRAEWNVARALLSSGEQLTALNRVRLLIEESDSEVVPDGLDIRLRWLEARLSLFAGQTVNLLDRMNALIERINQLSEGSSDALDESLLMTEVLLLKASIWIEVGPGDEGLALLKKIRADFPDSSAAARSFIIEGSYFASTGNLAEAQNALIEMAQNYRSSQLAPKALFEAAIYAEQRGPLAYADAIRIHDELSVRYPQSELAFVSRLRQGDLLRQMNDFAGAQILYENLINQMPEHPRRYLAELSRADSMLALAKDNQSQLQDVSLALERLVDLPNLPVDVQVEVSYKWGFALVQRELPNEAIEIFTLGLSRYLLDSERSSKLGSKGTYWMSRIMLELASVLEVEQRLGDAREVYLTLIEYKLPGVEIARSKLSKLQIADESVGI